MDNLRHDANSVESSKKTVQPANTGLTVRRKTKLSLSDYVFHVLANKETTNHKWHNYRFSFLTGCQANKGIRSIMYFSLFIYVWGFIEVVSWFRLPVLLHFLIALLVSPVPSFHSVFTSVYSPLSLSLLWVCLQLSSVPGSCFLLVFLPVFTACVLVLARFVISLIKMLPTCSYALSLSNE